MESKFKETSEMILKQKDHKDGLIRRTVIELCANLAAHDSETFVLNYLSISMSYLLSQLKKERERSVGNCLNFC